MTLPEFFKTKNLDNSFVIGYYGGTNFGDELLLEILQNFLKKKNTQQVSIYYTDFDCFKTYHHDFGYKLIDPKCKFIFLKKLISSKHIIIGGGGLWGLDTNFHILLLCFILLFLRIIKKEIHVISVGYYNSTNFVGHLAARLTAIAASTLIVRDPESFKNFKKYTSKVKLDKDLSFYLDNIDLNRYVSEAKNIINEHGFSQETILIGLRRFKKESAINYTREVVYLLKKIENFRIVVVPFESEHFTKNLLEEVYVKKNNIQYIPFHNNPISFYIALKMSSKNIIMIAPQYHAQIIAHFAQIPYLPISYDNKVSEMHKMFQVRNSIEIRSIKFITLNEFIDKYFVKT